MHVHQIIFVSYIIMSEQSCHLRETVSYTFGVSAVFGQMTR